MHGSPNGIASGAVHVPRVRQEIRTTLTAELPPEDIASVVSFFTVCRSSSAELDVSSQKSCDAAIQEIISKNGRALRLLLRLCGGHMAFHPLRRTWLAAAFPIVLSLAAFEGEVQPILVISLVLVS
jgi:hypothetical protein